MAGRDSSIRVKKPAFDVHHISGYTRPFTQEFLDAGAEWDGKLLVWVYKGATLPAKIQNIIIGQFALNPETPMDAIIDEPQQPAGESDSETTVVNFKDVMEYHNKRTGKWSSGTKFVYIGRANGQYNLPASTWANTHAMQNQTDEERQRVIELYRQDLLKMDRATLLEGLKKLKGKTLVCWCKKADREVACHGDVLVEFINNPPPLEVEPKPAAPVEPEEPFKLTLKGDSKAAAKFRKLAEGLQKDIDYKGRPYPFESQPPTRKRVDEYFSRKDESRELIQLQDKLSALADGWESGQLHHLLRGLQTKTAVMWLLFTDRMPHDGNNYEQTDYNNLVKGGITEANYADARAALLAIGNRDAGQTTPADLLEEKRLQVALKDYADYFPTSMGWLQSKMIEAADIQRGDVILEPSAGTGHLAQAIQAEYPENELRVIEIVPDFRAILEMLGFKLVGHDFLQYNDQVDVIIQNPPFGKMEDIDHVYHAWLYLKPGGRLVSIMSAGVFFNSQKKATEFRRWFSANSGHMEKLREGAFKESERSTGVATVMISMRKPKEAAGDDPVVEHAEEYRQWEKDVVTAEAVAREALQTNAPDALDKMVKAVEIGQERQAIVERFRERMAEGEQPIDAAIGALDEAVKNPTSTICEGCHKATMYTLERNGKRYCEECLPTPGGLPIQDAEWIRTGKPAAESDDVVKTASHDSIFSVEGAARILYGFREDLAPLTYDDYKRMKTDYPDAILMLHIGAMWTTWDDDVEELQASLAAGSRERKHKVKAIEGVDTAKRPMASFNERNTELLEATVCEGARATLVFVNKDGSIRVREPKSVDQLNQEVKEASARVDEATEVLDEGISKLTEFLDAKKSEISDENSVNASENACSTSDSVDAPESDAKANLAPIASKITYTKDQLVGLHLLRGKVIESNAVETRVVAGADSHIETWQTSEIFPVVNNETFKKDDSVIDMYGRVGLVVWSNGFETLVKFMDGDRVADGLRYYTASLRRPKPTELVEAIQEGEQRIVEAVLQIRDMLRKPDEKPTPAPESEIPFIALYLSGAENVELLFNHYVTAIRADDPAMTPTSVKGAAAAVLLYQYQQEWASIDVEAKYPAIFEAFKAAAKGEILITMLLRISGLSSIVELTYNDDLMTRLVDLVSYVPF